MGVFTAEEVRDMVDTVNMLANAVLLEIADPGPLAGNGDPGSPVPVWTGEAPGALARARQEGTTGDRESQGLSDTFQVYDAVAEASEIAGPLATASTVVIRDETRGTPITSRWTVKGTRKETEGTLDSITLDLEGERTP